MEQTNAVQVMNDKEAQRFTIFRHSPEEIRRALATCLGDGTDFSSFDLPHTSVPSQGGVQWMIESIAGNAQPAKEIAGIIIYWHNQRTYWSNPNPTNDPPDCYSPDAMTGIGNPGGRCASCPYGQFGSDQKGGSGQACKQSRRLFLLRPDKMLPFAVSIPPTSLQPCRQFMLRLVDECVPANGVIVGLGLSKATNKAGAGYSRITFRVIRKLNPDQIAQVDVYTKAVVPGLQPVVPAVAKTVDAKVEPVADQQPKVRPETKSQPEPPRDTPTEPKPTAPETEAQEPQRDTGCDDPFPADDGDQASGEPDFFDAPPGDDATADEECPF